MISDKIVIPNPPTIPGLTYRHFQGENDFPKMVAVFDAWAKANGVEETLVIKNLAESYAQRHNSDPSQNTLFIEHDGDLIAYSRGTWWEEPDGPYLYHFSGFMLPEWQRKGLGTVILRWMENYLRRIAVTHPPDRPKFFQIFVGQDHTGTKVLLERYGYRPFRYIFDMERSLLDNLPAFPMPEGLEVRPVLQEHYRPIWEAGIEASQESLGFQVLTEEDYEAWQKNPVLFQPHLWQIAWDIASNQIAGQVQTFINHAENEKFNRKRGYTERISVRRPWRRRGLARALISISLKVQKANGMTESALSVDADNQSGATRIYEDCGFQITKRDMLYRKPL